MAHSPSPVRKETGLLSLCFWGVIKLIIWTVAGWCLALFISVGLLVFQGIQPGLMYLHGLWLNQTQLMAEITHHNWLLQKPAYASFIIIKNFINAIFYNSHFIEILVEGSNTAIKNPMIQHFAKAACPLVIAYVQALALTTAMVTLRFITVLLFLPVYGLLGFTGLIDGLVQRDLRRFGGGRESALLYHRAKFYGTACLQWGLFLYLILPFAIQPEHLLLPFAILFGFAIAVTAKTFKKYL